MAHHNNTPQTVLDAPAVTKTWWVRHTGKNRAMRRERFVIGNRRVWGVYSGTNVPYRKPVEAPGNEYSAQIGLYHQDDGFRDLAEVVSIGTELHAQVEGL